MATRWGRGGGPTQRYGRPGGAGLVDSGLPPSTARFSAETAAWRTSTRSGPA
ncbi:hypothetical protein I546_5290 [Mycobacterium kansasii 732]|uniref:Uncharacterized protein n=1 Tax=Mycobacterium kansasii 662 TaxID=1299326 RepID=X7ZFX6_MYCKA|nr:hypothetical protein I546_5290 [Mycobacterium kansasii 732]EUA17921.1 hypothetical protein I545_3277 [Mycobacterium kansasii 662]